MRWKLSFTLLVVSMLLSACGSSSNRSGSISAQYQFSVTLELSNNDAFIERVSEIARRTGFKTPNVRNISGFGTTVMSMESEFFYTTFSNASERMGHRTDAICKATGCEIPEDAALTTYKVNFYCNWVDCDLSALTATAQKFHVELGEHYSVSDFVTRGDVD